MMDLGPNWAHTGFTGFVLAYADAVLFFPHVQLAELTPTTIELSYLND